MSQGSLNPKIRFLGQKMCPAARERTDGQTHTKVTTEGTLSGFQEFFLQPIIKDRPNIQKSVKIYPQYGAMDPFLSNYCPPPLKLK